jgi:heme-degrading monooxygenase HmoA
VRGAHSVRPKLERLTGFHGLYLLRRRQADGIEFLVLTLWESMDAVRYEVLAAPDDAG